MSASVVIKNSVATTSPGFGSPTVVSQSLGNALSAGPTAVTTALTSPAVVRSGYVRVQIIGGGSSDVTGAFTVSLTDGTGTVYIANVAATALSDADTTGLDMVFPFCVDINVNSWSVTYTLATGTTTATGNFELVGNP